MTVLLPNATLALRRRVDQAARNAYGEKVQVGWSDIVGPGDGRASEQTDGSWNLGLDPALWPVRVGDLVIDTTVGGSWLVTSSDLIRNNYDSTVDWIRVVAQHRTAGGTEPGGSWFVARYDDHAEPPAPEPPPPPSKNAAGLWVGYGPPPAVSDAFWPQVGEEYLDVLTGLIYQLGE